MGNGWRRAVAATKATRRTPQQQANDFVIANDARPVIAGRAIEENPNKPAKGGFYQTSDGKWHRLGFEAIQLLPAGYPKWLNL